MSAADFNVISPAKPLSLKSYDGLLLLVPTPEKNAQKAWEAALDLWPREVADVMKAYGRKVAFEGKAQQWFSLDLTPGQRAALVMIPRDKSQFVALGLCRKVLEPFYKAKDQNILVDLRALDQQPENWADALMAARMARLFSIHKYGKSPDKKETKSAAPTLNFCCASDRSDAVTSAVERAIVLGVGINQTRELIYRAGNDLTPKRYVKHVEDVAAKLGFDFEFYGFEKLKKMGAGAFVAVAQGSDHKDAGIVKLTYAPKTGKKGGKPVPSIAIVGKGVTYDTGGVNLKPARAMFGMHSDMTGSAVVLSLLETAAKRKWPVKVQAYLAIADNAISDRAYRPNDVVTSLKGDTIEIIHTDAEGRMMLADTLHLAAQEKPDLVLEYSTLTGACVGAIGTTYAGVFSNRSSLWPALIEAGIRSGERVWPFPMDEDFGECLESKVADVKQCRLTGGVDHIEAAIFLNRFVGDGIPFIHVDLAASENSGGLAQVDTDHTGFGVRFGNFFLEKYLGLEP